MVPTADTLLCVCLLTMEQCGEVLRPDHFYFCMSKENVIHTELREKGVVEYIAKTMCTHLEVLKRSKDCYKLAIIMLYNFSLRNIYVLKDSKISNMMPNYKNYFTQNLEKYKSVILTVIARIRQ